MSHDIGAMFYFGERPWHQLGTRLDQPATLDEALAAGRLDWKVELLPLAIDEPAADKVSQRLAVARCDRQPGARGRILGVVHRNFVPLQNREGAELFDQLLDLGNRRYHTGGYLRDGEVVWLQARLPDDIVVTDDDRVETYLLYSNSHDGSRAIDLRLTTVRVVCQNTLSLALESAAVHAPFRRAHRHPPAVLAAQATEFFASVRQRIGATQALFRRLHAAPCDDAAFRVFLAKLLPDPPKSVDPGAADVARTAHATRIANLAADRRAIERVRSAGVPEANVPADAPTWWGAVNAVSAWVDHAQSIKGSRYVHAMFGSGNRLKAQALELVTVAVGR